MLRALSSPWSAEARVLLRPVTTYRELAAHADEAAASGVRRPLMLAFVLGCVVSALASGRLHLWLIVDGALSFAFVPIVELIAFAIVSRIGKRRAMPFARAVDLYFVGFAPWLIWSVVIMAVWSAIPPREAGPWFMPTVFASCIPLTWAACLDFLFFREVMQRSIGGAFRDLVLQRAISWTGCIGYFFGIVIVSELPKIARWLNLSPS